MSFPFDRERWRVRAGRVHDGLEAIRSRVQPRIDNWLRDWRTDPDRPEADFVADADYYMIYQEPLRARLLVRTLGVVVAVFILLASVTNVDEITKGEGKVIPSRQLQVLQSLDGGIVSQIAVQEGQIVEANQLLLQIDSTRFESSAREGQAQYSSLLAKAARLRALAEGKPFIPPPEAVKDDPQTVEEERRLYEAKTNELEAQVSIARQQLAQRQQELTEVRAKRDQAAQAYDCPHASWQ